MKMLKFINSITLIISISLNTYSNSSSDNLLNKLDKKYKANTICFTENKGQIVDQNYKSRPDVLFGGQTGGLTFHLRNNGISYQLNRVDKWKEVEDLKTKEKRKEIDQQTIYRIDINWLNVNTSNQVLKKNALEGYSNFYTEGCPEGGALNILSYKEVTYQNLYSGIDLKWYEKKGELKYDYLCAAGTDYKQIQLQIKGAGQLSINSKGELLIKTPLGTVIEKAPIVIQQGRELKSKWILKNEIISFYIQNLNNNLPYVIDPGVRLWGTYYGGTGTDVGFSCSTDALNNVYLGGKTSTNTGTVIATVGAHQSTFGGGNTAAGNTDAFLVKFNSAGVRQWSTYYGGTGDDEGRSCKADASGNVYLAGYTASNTGTVIATAGAHQIYFGGNNTWDAFLVKFNSAGVRLWGTYYGGTGQDEGHSCSTDPSGNVYLAGYTSTNTGTVIATTGAFHSTYAGGWFDAFIVKFNSAGVRQWGTYFGSNGNNDLGYSCCNDAFGNVYLTGRTDSNIGTVITTASAHQTVFGGGFDAFLIKFNSMGVRQWSTYCGGIGSDQAYSCTTDGSGNVYIAGSTDSSNDTMIATVGAHQSSYLGGGYDAFLVKFNSAGIRQWGTYYGTPGQDEGRSCSADASGNAYLSGFAGSSTGTVIATADAHQTTSGGGNYSTILVKFNSNGVRQWGTYYGASGEDIGFSNSTDATGSVYLAGYTNTNTSTVIATPGAHQFALSVGDAFLVKFTDCIAINPTAAVNATVCAGVPLNFTASITSTDTPNYSWSGPNSYTSNIQNPSLIASGPENIGIYTVTVNNVGCIETATTQVNIVQPNPTITINSGTICSGQSFTLVPSGATTYTYTSGSNVVSPTISTTYSVSGTDTNGCVSANDAVANVTVNSLPSISVNSGTICSGQSFTLVPSGATTYSYSSGSDVVTPTINATYSVSGTDGNGCVSSIDAVANVTVNSLPSISVNSGTICSGQSFTLVPSGATTYSYSSGSNVVTPTINATYSVSGTDFNGCASANDAIANVTVMALPILSVTPSNTLICAGQSATISVAGASSYTWSSNENTPDISVSPTTTTTYSVAGTDINGCVALSSITQSVSLCTSIDELINETILITPNPFNDHIYLNFNTIVNVNQIIVSDVLGKIVYNELFSQKNVSINLSKLSVGIYYLTIINDRNRTVKKLIKE